MSNTYLYRLLFVCLLLSGAQFTFATASTLNVATWNAAFNPDDSLIIITDGGSVSTVEGFDVLNVCSGDGQSDVACFVNDAVNTDSVSYVYVLVNSMGRVIDFLAGDKIELEGSPTEQCRLYGLAYAGDLALQRGDDFLNTQASSCGFNISSNFVAINIEVGPCIGGMFKNMPMTTGSVQTNRTASGERPDAAPTTFRQPTLSNAATPFSVFPNPTKGPLTVQLGEAEAAVTRVQLFNTNGVLVREQHLQSGTRPTVTVATSDLAPGLYQLLLSTDNQMIRSHKIVVSQ